MSDPHEQMQRLQEEAEALPDGPTKVALLEEAVRHADVLQDVDRSYRLRKQLIDAAFFDRPEVMLVAFAWCLAQSDRDPQRFEQDDLLWEYKWVITVAVGFPDIDRPRLEELVKDMERRYREAGASMFSIHHARRDLMIEFGDKAAARTAHAAFKKCRPDARSYPPAVVAYKELQYHGFQRQWGHAVRAAQPILDGRLKNADIFAHTLSEVLFPLLRLGRIEEGKMQQRRGYRLICRHSYFVNQVALHLRFLVLIDDLAQAKRLVERHLADALNYVLLNERFAYLLAARLWTDRLVSLGTERIKVRLPPGPPGPDAEGKSNVRQLGDWFTKQAEAIARRFDARNGNAYFQQQIDELPELLRLATS